MKMFVVMMIVLNTQTGEFQKDSLYLTTEKRCNDARKFLYFDKEQIDNHRLPNIETILTRCQEVEVVDVPGSS